MLKKFNMINCKIDGDSVDETQYRSLIGGLMYLQNTRPDISFYVNMLSRFMQNPSKNHYGAAKRVLRYIAGTADHGLWYEKNKDVVLRGYCDSDWASCLDDRKSTSGYAFSLGSGVISWGSKKQNSIALSSTEAEYISATGATCQAIWLRRILEDLGMKQEAATVIWCDSKSAIHLSKNPALHGRSKHIELKHHFIRELVAQKQVSLEFCSTTDQMADLLTKSLPKTKFMHFKEMLGVRKLGLREGVEI
jgi:hypothetical protein